MSNEVNLYNVSDGIALKVFQGLDEFNRGRREDGGYYAVSVATAHRSVYALWRIFKAQSPLILMMRCNVPWNTSATAMCVSKYWITPISNLIIPRRMI